MANASVATGPAMEPEEERQHKRQLAVMYAEEAERAVEVIGDKLDGMKQSLATAEAEAHRLRAEADDLCEGTD